MRWDDPILVFFSFLLAEDDDDPFADFLMNLSVDLGIFWEWRRWRMLISKERRTKGKGKK